MPEQSTTPETCEVTKLSWTQTLDNGRRAFSGIAIAARLNGDEFIIVAPSHLALLDAVKDLQWKHGCNPLKFRAVKVVAS